MTNEQVTGIYFNESNHRIWIMYTKLYPERIDDVDKEEYMGLLKQLSKTNGTRYDLYQLLLFKRQTEPCIFGFFETSTPK
ncbi:hypothetical protein [Shewanella piezotolerans]|uniref:hypothetical protein n=1 Tax=Shewanella piezotolerans TaxID=404011 RepID=UPI00164F16DF|nr:hypothetical protein [Shewanella piezotolerans]